MKRSVRFHSPSEIREHLSRQQSSNLSVENYCTQAKVSPSTFWNWRKKYQPVAPISPLAPFIRIPTQTSSVATPVYEIVFENKTTLKVPIQFDKETLQSLVSILH